MLFTNRFSTFKKLSPLFLILLDAHCSAALLFLGFSFMPTGAPLAGLDYVGVKKLNNGCLRIEAYTVVVSQPIRFEIFTHSKSDNVLFVELYFFYQSVFFFLLHEFDLSCVIAEV